MTNTKELNDEQLKTVTGGAGASKNSILSTLVVGDVVSMEKNEGYKLSGLYCLVSISNVGRYKFIEYTKGGRYIENGISFTELPEYTTIAKVGHDDEFPKYN